MVNKTPERKPLYIEIPGDDDDLLLLDPSLHSSSFHKAIKSLSAGIFLILLVVCIPMILASPDPKASDNINSSKSLLPVAVCDAATPYECGRQIGEQMSSLIQSSLESEPDLVALANWVESTSEGRDAIIALEEVNKIAYPDAWEEVEGIIEGSRAPRALVLAANLAGELSAIKTPPATSRDYLPSSLEKHCTDVHLLDPKGGVSLLGHNEDNERGHGANGYMVVARIRGSKVDGRLGYEYCGFAYPGALVGWAWGFNGHGVAQTINALLPVDPQVGRAVSFASRDALQAVSLQDAVHRLDVAGYAGGISVNLGRAGDVELGRFNVETSPQGTDVLEIETDNADKDKDKGKDESSTSVYYHTNIYLHNSAAADAGSVPHIESSNHRLAKLKSLGPPTNQKDVLARLGDTSDINYPIYRNQTAPDYATTLNSVLLDFHLGTASVWTFWTSTEDPWRYDPQFGQTAHPPQWIFNMSAGYEDWVRTAKPEYGLDEDGDE